MTEPKLQPPGAGLPFFENLFIRYVFLPRMKRKLPWDKADALFGQEMKKTLYLCKDLPKDLLAKRVLIPRIRGIEDSSRYWSIDMTLEHMIIVAKGMADIIETLALEKPFLQEVKTAEVKPKTGEHGDMEKIYAGVMTDIATRMKNIRNRNSKTTHPHPWFGPLNSNDWHVLVVTHQHLHNHQIKQIIAGLHR
jgi:hypothetical protein